MHIMFIIFLHTTGRMKCILACCIIVGTVYVYIPAYYVCQYMRVHYICPLEPSIKFSRSGLSQRIAEGLYIGRGSCSPEFVLFGYNIPSKEKYDIERQRGAWPGPLSWRTHRIFAEGGGSGMSWLLCPGKK
jgi:hypothetical protein